MTNKATEIMHHCNFTFFTTGANAGKVKVTPKAHAEGKRIYNELVKGMWKEEVAEIKAYLIAEHEKEVEAAAIRREKINAIEGLKEIRAAIDDIERYREEFNAMMDDEFNDGVFPPKKPTANISELKAKYPRAVAYIKAEEYSFADHHVKSEAGKKAIDRIINGEDYAAVITDMEAEWGNFCAKHMWD